MSSGKNKRWLSTIKKNAPIMYLAVFLVIGCLFVPNFASKANFLNILKQSAVPIIACTAMTFILITGNIDLSTGYIVGLVSISCGVMIQTLEFPPYLAIVCCLLIGCAAGACNGLLVTICEIPSFIVTLGSVSLQRLRCFPCRLLFSMLFSLCCLQALPCTILFLGEICAPWG